MLHNIPTEQIGPHGPAMTKAVAACVHCGFCLPTCPTYQVLGEEMDSPRGRIFLMKEVLEGQLDADEVTRYTDRCLGCVACVTSCPSGVEYGELITAFRATTETERRRPLAERMLRRMVLATLPYPSRFRWAARMGRLARPFERLMPGRLRTMLALVPTALPASEPLPEHYPAQGTRRARVALLAGCAQQVLAPEINWATLRVLAANGVEVVIPRSQTCCGALAAHTGAASQAKQMARNNLTAFPKDVDAIVTNAAGCGSGMHEYGSWLAGEPDEQQAREFSAQVVDVSVLLDDLGLVGEPRLPQPVKVAYHDACHLAHAQRVTSPPRRLLSVIENVEVAEIPDHEICCGSAGTYNLEQPAIAETLGRQKAEAILSTGAAEIVTGNIGCMMQIKTHLAKLGQPLPIHHTIELIDRAYSERSIDL